jgi:hypothetical protein
MSSGRIILCVALLAAGALCAFISTLIGSEMQGEVNKQLPHDKQLEGPWWFGKRVRLCANIADYFQIASFVWHNIQQA